MCDTEAIMSKLGNETVLRNHILGLIATGDVSNIDDIVEFMRDTFYGSESSLYGIESAVENIVDFLCENKMVERRDDDILALPFGKRVSDLYIDPKSAVILRDAVEKMDEDTLDLPILHAVASTPDVLGLYPKKKDQDFLAATIREFEDDMLVDVPDDMDYSYEYFLSDLKTACLIQDWIGEMSEDVITDSFGIGPGDIRSRVDMMDWLLYAMSEIAVLFKPSVVKRLREMLTRVRYGIRSELIELVSMKGVGRARARSLYDHMVKTRDDIARIDVNALAAIPSIGNALAHKLKEEVGQKGDVYTSTPTSIEEDEELTAPAGPKQSSLFDFN